MQGKKKEMKSEVLRRGLINPAFVFPLSCGEDWTWGSWERGRVARAVRPSKNM